MNNLFSKKNLVCFLTVLLFLFLLFGDHVVQLFLPSNPNDNYTITKEKEEVKVPQVPEIDDYDISFMVPITIKEVIQKIDAKENVYLFSGRSTCAPCKRFVPILKEVQEEKQVRIYYIDRNAVRSDTEGYQVFLNYAEELALKFGSTPYFMFFADGMYRESLIGFQENLKEKLLLMIK